MNFVEIKSPVRCSCHGQVPRVDGIKRPAKQCDTSGMDFRRGAVRLRCRQYASQVGVRSYFLMNSGDPGKERKGIRMKELKGPKYSPSGHQEAVDESESFVSSTSSTSFAC
jgi:hypothetical protein